jgi:uncharacterized protein YyaL (SSP411 family)
MIKAYAQAYDAFQETEFLQAALTNAEFIWETQLTKEGALLHSYKQGKSTINGYLEDYAFVIESFLTVYRSTLDEKWLSRAQQLTEYTMKHFYDEASGMFWFTSDLDPPLIARKQEVMDNVIPASNSAMARALFELGTYFYNKEYLDISTQMLRNVRAEMNYGQSYSNWAMLMLHHSYPFYEVAITGEYCLSKLEEMNRSFLPNVLLMGGVSESELPLLEGKFFGETTIFVCEDKACQLPVSEVCEAQNQISW